MKLRVPIALVGALTALAGFGAPNAAAAGPLRPTPPPSAP